jgi:hypothetical protein
MKTSNFKAFSIETQPVENTVMQKLYEDNTGNLIDLNGPKLNLFNKQYCFLI